MFETVRKVHYGMWKNKTKSEEEIKSHIANEYIYTVGKGYAFDRFSLEYISICECQEKKNTMEIKICHIPRSWSKHITGGSPQYWVSAVAAMTTNEPSSICT